MLLVQQPDVWVVPHGAVEIPVQVGVPSTDGRFTRQFFVRLATSAGHETETTLEVQGEALASAKVFPSSLNFGVVDVKDLVCRPIRVQSRRVADLRQAEISFRTDSRFVGVNVGQCRADLLTLDAYLMPPLPFGTFRASIAVTLQDQNNRISLDIPVIASVTSDIYPVPKSLIISQNSATVGAAHLLELRSRQGLGLDVVSVACPPGIEVLEQVADSSRVRIRFGIDRSRTDRAEEPIVVHVKSAAEVTSLAVPVCWAK